MFQTVSMMKRASMGARLESYEHVLMCLICRNLFDDYDHQPKFLPCHHTFCKDCLREYVQHVGDEIECPSCRKIANIPAAGIAALQTNFYVKYIQSLVLGSSDMGTNTMQCSYHPDSQLKYYCHDCHTSQCDNCKCTVATHKRVPLTTVTEEYHQKLDTSFTNANALVECKKVELEGMLKAFSEEKDHALLKIDATMEQHVHTLSRRATLLKNKVIDIYNEHVQRLEADLEEISTAMTCIVSLKEFHENMISRGEFNEIDKGIGEMGEVYRNINERIKPMENHIVFEEKHGADKLRACTKDLGRVRSKRPPVARTEPEGNDDGDCMQTTLPLSASPLTSCAQLNQGATGTTCTVGAEDMSVHYEMSHSGTAGSQVTAALSNTPKACLDHTLKPNSSENKDVEKPLPDSNQNANNLDMPTPSKVCGRNGNNCDRSNVMAGERSCCSKDSQRQLLPNTTRSTQPRHCPSNKSCVSMNMGNLTMDKSYLHLVYTSYDEEEMLRELKSSKSTLTEQPTERHMDDSDSWMTISSSDDNSISSPVSDDLAIQSQL
ncbi:hypothetical protein NP493_1222g00060 [Ridgeia piscesae]|uniref:Uncharacterized protein n=2 Tax=Ridgeia piscesae TaxID=27915 RepID=A0AAD9KBQ2_RIDPI|nr:hypothetical protein NP493_1222g00060 [Ridgeia piscesae]